MSDQPTHDYDMLTTKSVKQFYSLVRELSDPPTERRREERYPSSVALRIQPLDVDFRPCSEPFCALTRDISRSGLGFINAEPFDHEYLRLSIAEHGESTIIGKVCYNLSIGVDQPLYLVGVQFVG